MCRIIADAWKLLHHLLIHQNQKVFAVWLVSENTYPKFLNQSIKLICLLNKPISNLMVSTAFRELFLKESTTHSRFWKFKRKAFAGNNTHDPTKFNLNFQVPNSGFKVWRSRTLIRCSKQDDLFANTHKHHFRLNMNQCKSFQISMKEQAEQACDQHWQQHYSHNSHH